MNRRRRTVLQGALSPTTTINPNISPPSSSSTAAPSSTLTSLDTGLGLFAAFTTSDPRNIQISDLKEALNNTRKELEARNLLLIRSKEALSTLGERLSLSQNTIQTLQAQECKLEAEFDGCKTTFRERETTHVATVQLLKEHLTTVRTQCARDMTTAREEFALEEHTWKMRVEQAETLNAELCIKLNGNEEELMQAQENIENLVTEVSTMEVTLLTTKKLSEDRLIELKLVKEQCLMEKHQRKELAARVSTTEFNVVTRLRKKQIEVEDLQLKVFSQKKHLRRSKKKNEKFHHTMLTTTTTSSSSSNENKENASSHSVNLNSASSTRSTSSSSKGKLRPRSLLANTCSGRRTPIRTEEEKIMRMLKRSDGIHSSEREGQQRGGGGGGGQRKKKKIVIKKKKKKVLGTRQQQHMR